MRFAICFVLLIGTGTWAPAQSISVNKENKTIAVSSDATAVAEPDIAILHIGSFNYGATRKEAYDQNLTTSEAILKAIHALGITDKEIEGEEFQITHVEPEQNWTETQKRERQFAAKQAWKIRLPAGSAQNVLDAAIRAGANASSQPDWDVIDRAALQARAGELALQKAKRIAESMASGLGVKLEHLIYASNRAESFLAPEAQLGGGGGGGGRPAPPPPPPVLKLYSAKVTQDATVYAVFEIE